MLLLFVSFDMAKSMLGVVLDLMCSFSSFSGIGSSFVTSEVALKIQHTSSSLNYIPALPQVLFPNLFTWQPLY
jgi:hypothetical protein